MESPLPPQRILIIEKSEKSLDQVSKYLARRGWEVTSVSQLKPAVLKALETKAQFVLIPMDHPNKGVKQLPQVFTQLLGANVIPYIETHSASAILDIKRQGLKNTIIPPILGPKVERMINKIILDLKEQPKDQNKRSQGKVNQSSEASDVITIKSVAEKLVSDSQVLTSTDSETGFGDSLQMFSNKKSDYFVSYLQKGAKLDLPSTWIKKDSEDEGSYQVRLKELLAKARTQSKPEEKIFFDQVDIQAIQRCMQRVQESDAVTNEGIDYEPSPADIDAALMAVLKSPKNLPSHLTRKFDESEEAHIERIKKAHLDFKLENQVMNSMSNFDVYGSDGDYSSVMDEATFSALKKIHEQSVLKEVLYPLEKTSQITCLSVESESFNGYVIAASAKELIKNPDFQKILFRELKKSFAEKSIDIKEEDVVQLEMQSLSFLEWAVKKATFVRQGSYEGEEIGLAYFPIEEFKPLFQESAFDHLLQVKTSDLSFQQKMDFDLFIYLPLNKHLILYSAPGQQAFEAQIKRLAERGIEFMYAKKSALPQIKKYQAEMFLEEQLKEDEDPLVSALKRHSS